MSFMFQGKNNHTKRIDDFIRYTLTNRNRRSGKMELIDSQDLEFIAEGGFSKVYKATCNTELE